jgi:hypothetical protein
MVMIPTVFVFPIIPFSMLVPVVVVLSPAVFAFPVTCIVMPALIPRSQPVRTFIRRTSPVSFVPIPVVAYGIPVPFDPEISGTGLGWANAFDSRRRRRTDLNAD